MQLYVIDKDFRNGVINFVLLQMQRLMEETLTKNMHLQQDLENLSQEVARLSDRCQGGS